MDSRYNTAKDVVRAGGTIAGNITIATTSAAVNAPSTSRVRVPSESRVENCDSSTNGRSGSPARKSVTAGHCGGEDVVGNLLGAGGDDRIDLRGGIGLLAR